jgi:hypothetical protein
MNPAFYRRFATCINQLNEILGRCADSPAPGLVLYREGARAVLFRLEGLTKLYFKITGNKRLEKWQRAFKKLEDRLGAIDYLDSMSSEFSQYPESHDLARIHFHVRFSEESAALGEFLQKKGWLDGHWKQELEDDLEALERLSSEEDLQAVAKEMSRELVQLEEDYSSGEYDFWKLEAGLHEFRRKIRWISIYAAAMEGAFQLKMVPVKDDAIQGYLQGDIIEAPFNRFPSPELDYRPIWVQSTWFFALSWLIDYLGQLKDCCQRYHACVELFEKYAEDPIGHNGFIDVYGSRLPYVIDDIPVFAEAAVDKFFYRDSIGKRLVRDLRRG